MIPLRDDIPSSRFPFVNTAIIVLCVLGFLYEVSLGPGAGRLVFAYGAIPLRIFDPGGYGAGAREWAPQFVTALFLHGGWVHLGGNMLYLWIFGDNVEDRLGHIGYALFYLLCGIIATLSHSLVAPGSQYPLIGASGAIAGVLGAYVVSYPGARVLTVVPFFYFVQFLRVPAVIVLGFWFVLQLLSGAASITAAHGGGVAWFAHIGGFVAGALLVLIFPDRRRRKRRFRRAAARFPMDGE
ncbi:MAG: rhomboid family intramembrane serine protease [bacterium]